MTTIQFSENSVFGILKNSGENFFKHQQGLEDIKTTCLTIKHDTHEKYEKIKSKHHQIDEAIFQSMQFEKSPEILSEKRNDCSPDESDLITTACREYGIEKDKMNATVDKIKLALGFKSCEQPAKKEYKKPCVAVVGQTKSGKSSLLNCMMREIVVPQRPTRLTARITYLTYSDIKFVAHMREKKLIFIKIGVKLGKEDVDLAFDKRYRKEDVGVEVRVGCENDILSNGFDIVDSPGLNENPALNELCQKMERSLLPLLIYVIDGRNGLTESDAEDIRKIKEAAKDLRIIYFATKLDRSEVDFLQYRELKQERGIPENEDMPGESEKEVADRRLDSVFQKLKKPTNDFVDLSTPSYQECTDFHGASLLYVNRVRISKKKIDPNQVEIYRYNVELMQNFERKLMKDLKHRIESVLVEVVKSIQTTITRILERITAIASDIVTERRAKLHCLEKFQTDESDFYEKEKQYISSQLNSKINELIDLYENEIIKQHSGRDVSGREPFKQLRQSPEEENILKLIPKENDELDSLLKQKLKEFLSRFMQDEDKRLRNRLGDLAKKLGTGKYGRSSFAEMLKERLFYDYELNSNWVSLNNQEELFSDSRRKVRQSILKDINSMQIPRISVTTDQGSTESSSTPEIDREAFFKHICSMITKEIKRSHDKFEEKLNEEGKILRMEIDVSVKEKDLLKAFSRELAYKYLGTVEITTNMDLIPDPQKDVETIMSGNQAKIKKIYTINSDKPIVQKTYRKPFHLNKENLKKVGMEVYYSSRLNDDRFLKLLGVNIEEHSEGDNMVKVSLFYPYLEEGSLEDYLRKKVGEEKEELKLKERMKLAKEIAGGMKHLHSLTILHCDLTLKNILLRRTETTNELQAVIADYGVMNPLGFIEQSHLHGSKRWEDHFFKASEIYNQGMLEKYGPSYAHDVFSFGIALWILLTYRLFPKPEYDNYYPKFVTEVEFDPDKVKEAVENGRRPNQKERRLSPLMSEDLENRLFTLMNVCWHKEQLMRPLFHLKLTERPTPLHDEDHPIGDETIVDVLEEIYQKIK